MTRRVLALHGYTQNSDTFHGKTGALRRRFRKEGVELVYANGPIILRPDQLLGGQPAEGETPRAWFTFADPQVYYEQQKQAMDQVIKTLRDEGPFEGILGFSQGACLLATLVAYHAQHPLEEMESIRYLIFVSGFIPQAKQIENELFSPLLEETAKKIEIPSLHIYGATDSLIPSNQSPVVANFFDSPTHYEHKGAHFVPANAAAMHTVKDFVAEALKKSEEQ